MEKGICAFTGHRKIKSDHEKKLPELLERAINYAYNRGCTDFYTGGAVGFDTIAAREVLKFRISHPSIRLILILPYLNQSEKWSAAQQDAYNYILRSADEVRYVTEAYYDGCIKERNLRLVADADIVIAYVSRYDSGSAQTVRMAKSRNKEVYNLYGSLDAKWFSRF